MRRWIRIYWLTLGCLILVVVITTVATGQESPFFGILLGIGVASLGVYWVRNRHTVHLWRPHGRLVYFPEYTALMGGLWFAFGSVVTIMSVIITIRWLVRFFTG